MNNQHNTTYLPPLTTYTASLFALLAYILLFFYLNYNAVINTDAFTYLKAARVLNSDGLAASLHIFDWPILPILLSSVSKISRLSLLHSGLLLNLLFICIIMLAFIQIIKTLGGSPKQQLLTALLVASMPQFNNNWHMLVRDIGYLACFLLALLCLLRYSERARPTLILGWFVCICAATLFRIEGAVFMLLAPLAFLWGKEKKLTDKSIDVLKLLLLPCLFLLALLIAWHVYPLPHSIKADLHLRLHYFISRPQFLLHGSIPLLKQKTDGLINVLPFVKPNAAWIIIILAVVSAILIKAIKTLSIAHTVILAAARPLRPAHASAQQWRIIVVFALIQCLIALVYMADHYFINSRYLLSLAFCGMIFVPFAFTNIVHAYRHNKATFISKRWLLPLIGLLLLYNVVDSLIQFGTDKSYLRTSSDWINQHISKQARVYINNHYNALYTHRFAELVRDDMQPRDTIADLADHAWEQYDYLVIQKTHHQDDFDLTFFTAQGLQPIATFPNNKHDAVYVFQVPPKPKA